MGPNEFQQVLLNVWLREALGGRFQLSFVDSRPSLILGRCLHKPKRSLALVRLLLLIDLSLCELVKAANRQRVRLSHALEHRLQLRVHVDLASRHDCEINFIRRNLSKLVLARKLDTEDFAEVWD